MRIHIVTNLFSPDELAGAALYTDLAKFLKTRGHDIRVTSTFSYYPAWQVYDNELRHQVRDDLLFGIPVRRVAMYVPKQPSGIKRLLSDLSFFYNLLLHGNHPGWKPQVVLTALPMLSQCLAQRFQHFGRRVPRMIVVQDFVVDAALELKILNIPGIGGLLRAVECFALNSGNTISTISPRMLDKVNGKLGTNRRRTLLIPNWIHKSLEIEIARQRVCAGPRRERSLFYSGNLGIKQGLPEFLDDFTASGSEWHLRIHGGGAELARLVEAAQRSTGVTLGGTLEESEYISLLLSSTACLITQRSGVGANFLPSKLLPALATGTPVLAICDRHSPLGEEVTEGGFGEIVAPNDPRALKEVLGRWSEEPAHLAELGRKASRRSLMYSREKILPLYEHELLQLIDRSPKT